MIYDELYDLKQYLVSKTGTNTIIGNDEVSPSEYPIIRIIFDNNGTLVYENEQQLTANLPITIKSIGIQGQEIQVLKIIDKILLNINNFKKYRGHKVDGGISPEYVDETGTYEIDVLYNLKLLFLGT